MTIRDQQQIRQALYTADACLLDMWGRCRPGSPRTDAVVAARNKVREALKLLSPEREK